MAYKWEFNNPIACDTVTLGTAVVTLDSLLIAAGKRFVPGVTSVLIQAKNDIIYFYWGLPDGADDAAKKLNMASLAVDQTIILHWTLPKLRSLYVAGVNATDKIILMQAGNS